MYTKVFLSLKSIRHTTRDLNPKSSPNYCNCNNSLFLAINPHPKHKKDATIASFLLLARDEGIEPPTAVLETEVIPLN